MNPTRWIYMFNPEGRVFAAKLTLNDKGEAFLIPGDKYFARLVESIGSGVYSHAEKRRIGMNEGEAYIEAVEQMFDTSSTWIVDEVPPSSN